jgi:hypothetical protein
VSVRNFVIPFYHGSGSSTEKTLCKDDFALVSLLLHDYNLSFSVPLALVQGPPGTGKSATIVGMVLQMWGARCNTKNKAQMPRILLVAPSNAAVDELARKLIAVKSQLPEDKRFKIIRIGEIL